MSVLRQWLEVVATICPDHWAKCLEKGRWDVVQATTAMSCGWNTVVICPVVAKGDPEEAANYCPVSLTTVVIW